MKRKYFWSCLTAMVIWTGVIFWHSLQPGAASTAESQWVLDVLQQVLPFDLSMRLVRKLGHFAQFAVLGGLAGLLFGGRCRRLAMGLLFAVMTGIVTALCDETIQLFVPGRAGQVPDIWIDIAGAFTGALLVLGGKALHDRRKDRSKPQQFDSYG